MANAEVRSTKVRDRQIENGPLLFERELVQRVTVVACPECNEAIYTVVGDTTDYNVAYKMPNGRIYAKNVKAEEADKILTIAMYLKLDGDTGEVEGGFGF